MLRLIKRLYKHNAFFLALVITGVIAFLSLARLGKQPISFSNIDKVQHAIAYGVLTFTWLVASAKNALRRNIVVVCCFLFGILMEYLQKVMTDYRMAELADIFANSLGVVTALLIFNFFIKKNKSNAL